MNEQLIDHISPISYQPGPFVAQFDLPELCIDIDLVSVDPILQCSELKKMKQII